MTVEGWERATSSEAALDRAGRVREPLDLLRLRAWLDAELPSFGSGAALEIEQFGSGWSNLTYLVRAGQAEVVLRRPPVGSTVASAHDMAREARVLQALAPLTERVPRVLGVCEDPAVLGAPFFVMERVRGIILRRAPPAGLELEPGLAARIGRAFVATLAELHALPIEELGFGHPEGYAERQLGGWIGRWRRAAEASPETDRCPAADALAAQLEARFGELGSGDPTLVHNDFKLDNLVLDCVAPDRVLAVLDWELATVGEPLLDLGTTLGYWTEAGDAPALLAFRSGPTQLPGMPSRTELAAMWAAASGRPIDGLAVATAFGLFKIAVIAQQIYVRFVAGTTRDPRFASLPAVVAALIERASHTLTTGAL